jgi:hypothetical protein
VVSLIATHSQHLLSNCGFCFPAHYHFLADIGKDLLGAGNDTIRNRLIKYVIQGIQRKRVLQWANSDQENPTFVQALVDGVKQGYLS